MSRHRPVAASTGAYPCQGPACTRTKFLAHLHAACFVRPCMRPKRTTERGMHCSAMHLATRMRCLAFSGPLRSLTVSALLRGYHHNIMGQNRSCREKGPAHKRQWLRTKRTSKKYRSLALCAVASIDPALWCGRCFFGVASAGDALVKRNIWSCSSVKRAAKSPGEQFSSGGIFFPLLLVLPSTFDLSLIAMSRRGRS